MRQIVKAAILSGVLALAIGTPAFAQNNGAAAVVQLSPEEIALRAALLSKTGTLAQRQAAIASAVAALTRANPTGAAAIVAAVMVDVAAAAGNDPILRQNAQVFNQAVAAAEAAGTLNLTPVRQQIAAAQNVIASFPALPQEQVAAVTTPTVPAASAN